METKFKVGDKVRAIKSDNIWTIADFHWEGEVTGVEDTCFNAKSTKCDIQDVIGHEYKNLEFKDYELIESKPILDEKEKEYLLGVIKPFIKKNIYITKDIVPSGRRYIRISFDNELICLPRFDKSSSMYKGLEENTPYTLEELGLVEPKPKPKCKFEVGDLVKVVNAGKCYSIYENWFERTDNNYLKPLYKYGESVDKDRDYIVVTSSNHPDFQEEMVVAIKDIKGQIYLMEQKGLEKVGQ